MNKSQLQKNDIEQLLERRGKQIEKELPLDFEAKLDWVIKNKLDSFETKKQEKTGSFIGILTHFTNKKSPFAIIVSAVLTFIVVLGVANIFQISQKTKLSQTFEIDSLLIKTEAISQGIDSSFQDFETIDSESSLDDTGVLALYIERTTKGETIILDLDGLLNETDEAEISVDGAILDIDLINKNEDENKIMEI